jgi:hypothetical protein
MQRWTDGRRWSCCAYLPLWKFPGPFPTSADQTLMLAFSFFSHVTINQCLARDPSPKRLQLECATSSWPTTSWKREPSKLSLFIFRSRHLSFFGIP